MRAVNVTNPNNERLFELTAVISRTMLQLMSLPIVLVSFGWMTGCFCYWFGSRRSPGLNDWPVSFSVYSVWCLYEELLQRSVQLPRLSGEDGDGIRAYQQYIGSRATTKKKISREQRK